MSTEKSRETICLDEQATNTVGVPYVDVRDELVPLGLVDMLNHGHVCARTCRKCNRVAIKFGVDPEGNIEISDDESRVYCTLALARTVELSKAAAQ